MRMDSRDEHADPDQMSRPVMAGRIDKVTGPEGMAFAAHSHRAAQMIYVTRGVLTCDVSQGLWIVPPQCALWIPGDVHHDVKGVGAIEIYSLFVDPPAAPTMPVTCCTVSVSPLLREILLRFADIPAQYPTEGVEARLATVLLDELAAAPVEKLHLPMPADGRLRQVAGAMAAEPSDRASVQEWAGRIGVSERTLGRLVQQETGMSFGRWRQQLHISLAIQWLTQGATVQSVATDLGYESSSSFVFMFRKVVGSSPARYMTEKRSKAFGIG